MSNLWIFSLCNVHCGVYKVELVLDLILRSDVWKSDLSKLRGLLAVAGQHFLDARPSRENLNLVTSVFIDLSNFKIGIEF